MPTNDFFMVNRDDVPWYEAPLPRRFHRCSAQTYGVLNGLYIERCACGAIQIGPGGWIRRNERRKYERTKRRQKGKENG